MSSVKFEKGAEEWQMFQEFWKLCQRHWIPEESNAYWDDLVSEVGAFHAKYAHQHLAKELALSFVEAQEKKMKKSGK